MKKTHEKVIEKSIENNPIEVAPEVSVTSSRERYNELQNLYKTLISEGIRSISDLENKIAIAEKDL